MFQQIISQSGSQKNIEIVDLLIKDIIINTPNVTGISNFSSTYQNRAYSFQCDVTTPFGDVTIAKTF